MMENIDAEMTPAQSLQIISNILSQTKQDISKHSFCFLLWGWLIAVASFLFFILHAFTDLKLYFLPFPIFAVIGIVATIIFYSGRKFAADTYLSHYIKRLWLVLGISFIIVVFINVYKQQPPFTYTLLICGIGTLTSGLALQFKPLIGGGILFLAFCILSLFVPDVYKPLLQGLGVTLGYLIPGYLLRNAKS